MTGFTLKALRLLTLSCLSMVAAAQVTYKCGNSYSQTPCPDAVAIDTNDRRTSAQKLQTDMATQRDARIANALEKARLQQETKDLAANTPALKASSPAPAAKNKADKLKTKRKKAPKAQVVKAPIETKQKKPSNSVSKEKAVGKS